VNCIPVFIGSEDYWNRRFKKAGLPIVGDDIKSQVGATIVHRTLARLMHDRGVKMLRTSQLNVGGNMDFFNMLERERLESKKISKTQAVTSIMGHTLPADDVYIGPSDYVPWLTDRKWAHIRMEGQAFGDVPLNMEMKLEVWDSPNSAGIVIDAVRCCKLALNHGLGGQLDGPSSYLMKSPHDQRPDDEAREDTEKFIETYGRPDRRHAQDARRLGRRRRGGTRLPRRPGGGGAAVMRPRVVAGSACAGHAHDDLLELQLSERQFLGRGLRRSGASRCGVGHRQLHSSVRVRGGAGRSGRAGDGPGRAERADQGSAERDARRRTA
jgi:hypothetical protein